MNSQELKDYSRLKLVSSPLLKTQLDNSSRIHMNLFFMFVNNVGYAMLIKLRHIKATGL